MHRLTRLSLGKIPIVLMLAALVVAGGLISMTQLRTELLPDIGFPSLSIVTVYPGAAPGEVNNDVTGPIEKALASTQGLEAIRSTSNDSVSFISVQYEYGTDMEQTQRSVGEILDRLQLPQGAQEPRIGRFSFQDIPIVAYTLNTAESGPDALVNLKRQVEAGLVPELEAIEGVNSVVVSGGGEKNIVITFDPEKLAANGVSAQQVTGVLQANNISFPAGDITANNQSIPVRVAHEFDSLERLRDVVVGMKMPAGAGQPAGAGTGTGAGAGQPGAAAGGTGAGAGQPAGNAGAGGGAGGAASGGAGGAQAGQPATPTPVTLADVATVELTNTAADSISRSNGKPSLSLVVYKTQNANTVDVAHRVDEALAAAAPGLNTEAVTLFDQASFIEESLNSLIREGVLGAILAIVVILVFLLSVRSTLVTAVSIPMSVLIAFIMLNAFDISLNIMSLAGLAVAIGRVVDDSIVVLENIYRHVAEGESVREAAFSGTKEVAAAITSSTITTVCVFLPLGFIAGLISEFFRPFAVAVTVALLASLVVALTIVPVLAVLFIRAGLVRKGEREQRDTWIQRLYTPSLAFALRSRGTKLLTLGLAALLFAASLVPLLTGAIGFTFINVGSDKVLTAQIELAPGADLATTSEVAAAVEEKLRQNEMVSNYQTTIGSNSQAAQAGFGGLGGRNIAQLTVTLEREADLNAEAERLRGELQQTAGVADYSVTYGTGGGFDSSNFSAVVSGGNYQDVLRTSDELVAKLKGVPDLVNVSSDAARAKPEIRIEVDPAKALQHGSSTIQIASQIRGLLTRQDVTNVTLDGTSYNVVAAYDPASVASAEDIRQIRVGTVNPVPLGDVATVEEVEGPVSITRVDQEQAITVNGTITSQSTSGVTAAARQAIAELNVPAGTRIVITGVTQQQTEAFGDMGVAIVVAVALVYIVMVATFGSLSTPFVILFSLPLAAIGSLLALWITGRPLGISALIGVLMLIGIVVTNAIVLLDLVEQYKAKGMSTYDALVQGGRTRVRPILMTAIATIIALIPLAMSEEGSLIAAELGTVVIGGLFTSTFLTLIVVPVVYSLLDGLRDRFGGRGRRVEEEPAVARRAGDVTDGREGERVTEPEREAVPVGARSQAEPAV